MVRSALAAIVLLTALFLSSASADAHSLAQTSVVAPRYATELVTVPSSQAYGGSPRCPDDTHGPHCCPAGVCSLVGCLAIIVVPVVFPIVPEKLAYVLSKGSRPDGASITPDLPPPRAIV
jgi:hypothetical protein